MQTIDSIDELRSLYDETIPGAITKVADHLTPLYQQFVNAARFTVLTTVGPEGTDASPRGDIDSVVRIVDPKTLWLPDWRGNNRLDSLENIVLDGRISLMFMVPGSNNVVRINGRAVLSPDESITRTFEHNNKTPRTVIVITVAEVYFQCAKALMRSALWTNGEKADGEKANGTEVSVPTAGQFLKEVESGFDDAAYDAGYPEYAKDKMW